MKRLYILGLVAGLSLAILPATIKAGPFQTVPYEPQPRPELYVFGYGGIHWMKDFEGTGLTGNPEIDEEAENGWGVGGGLGLRSDWLGGTRFEVEGLHRSNDVDGVLLGGVSFPSDGDADITGITFNFVKELVWGGLYPYVGIGVGYGELDVDTQFTAGGIDDSASSFLWQVMAGLDFPWTKRTSLYIEYRFMPMSDFDLIYLHKTGVNAGTTDTINFDDLSNHSLFGGIRFAF